MKRSCCILVILLASAVLEARTVYVIRHGQVGIAIQELKETRLTELGTKQAQAAAEYLVGKLKFNGAIYASPFYRTIETAKPTALLLGKKVFLEPGLQELATASVPSPPGMSLAQTRTYFPELTIPGPRFTDHWRLCNESSTMRSERVCKALDAILTEEKGDLLLVGHGASVGNLITVLNERRASDAVEAITGFPWNCALFIFELDDQNKVIGGRYTTEYLDDHDVTNNFRCPKIERPDDPQYMTKKQDKADRAKRRAAQNSGEQKQTDNK